MIAAESPGSGRICAATGGECSDVRQPKQAPDLVNMVL